jgi:GntR family transcriptional regulator/MocR family aminotransferase
MIHVTLDGRGDLAARIYRQLFDAIVDGRLRPGERLPPTRDLAVRLDVSRNTVALAYERLAAEGVVVGRVGAGTFVGADAVGPSTARARRAPAGRMAANASWASVSPMAAASAGRVDFDFGVGSPDASLFPFTAWRRLVARELRLTRLDWSHYADPGGHAGLRAAIARHAGLARSVRASADDIVVTDGAQHALDLIARVVLEPGDTVAVEEPGYPPARRLFQALGARLAHVPVDAEGLVVASIPRSTRVVYVTPSHQFPLGTPMSLARRRALLEWAAERNGLVIEDDYDSEFRFEGRPLEPLQSLDTDGRVVYVGSFSKVMLPALRLGFLVAPESLRRACLAARQLSGWHGSLPTQAALARFIDEGLLARHVRKVTREYADRRARIVKGLSEGRLGRRLRLVPSAAGLHVAAVATNRSVDWTEVARRAETRGVFVRPIRHFAAATTGADGLVLGYGLIPARRVDEGLRRIADAVARA